MRVEEVGCLAVVCDYRLVDQLDRFANSATVDSARKLGRRIGRRLLRSHLAANLLEIPEANCLGFG